MDKKGMTLIELIAVIAIMAILSLMIAPNIMEMRNQSVKSTVKNKISNIHNAAITYAEENLSSVPNTYTIGDSTLPAYGSEASNRCISTKKFTSDGGVDLSYCEKYCLFVYVNTLVDKGLLAGDNDDKTKVINPYDKTNLNEKKVCVRYDTDVVELDSSERLDRNNLSRKLIAYIEDEDSLCGSLGPCSEK